MSKTQDKKKDELRDIVLGLASNHYDFQRELEPEVDEAMQAIEAYAQRKADEAVITYRDKASTGGRPLSAPPLIEEMPVPCPRCKATHYADWFLYPHQVYNAIMPGGVGHYCFDCFCEIVVEKKHAALKTQTNGDVVGEETKR